MFLRLDSLNGLIFNPKFANINFPRVRKQSRKQSLQTQRSYPWAQVRMRSRETPVKTFQKTFLMTKLMLEAKDCPATQINLPSTHHQPTISLTSTYHQPDINPTSIRYYKDLMLE